MSREYIYKSERSWPNKRFKIGAIVGHTTATTCRLWIRTASTGSYTLIYYPKVEAGSAEDHFNGFKAVPYDISTLPGDVAKTVFEVTDFSKDTTNVLELTDLTPDTEYSYAVYREDGRDIDESEKEDRIILGHDRTHSFKSMPATEEPYSFALFSCNMPYKVDNNDERDLRLSNEKMWGSLDDTLKRHKDKGLRFIIGGGDQVYSDGVDHKEINLPKNLNTRMKKDENGELTPTKDEMVLWYRDIYRGYWGIRGINRIFSSYPSYMIWDDHEIWDGWGSYLLTSEGDEDDELHRLFPEYEKQKDELKARGLKREDLLKLKDRMFDAAKQVYNEYQHSHNPGDSTRYDYDFDHGEKSAFYFLDGRGERDVNRDKNRILGAAQLERLKNWLKSPEVKSKKVIFIVSAVPVLHVSPTIAGLSELSVTERIGLQDDLRDSWENSKHKEERKEFMETLFKAADDNDQRVVILSGDVHIAAAFKISNGTSVIHQLTSSAITYNIPLWESYLFSVFGVPDDGETEEGYSFKRLALYGDSNYSLVKVDFTDDKEEIEFQLYGTQSVLAPRDLPEGSAAKGLVKKLTGYFSEEKSLNHSIAKIPLTFAPF